MAVSADSPIPRSKAFRIGVWIAGIVGVAALLNAAILPLCSNFHRHQALTHNMIFGREVFFALEKYAEDHDGRFPSSLRELTPRYVTEGDLDRFAYLDSESRHRYEWFYFPGAKQTSPPDTLILASPEFDIENFEAKRIVIRVDGIQVYLPEKVFREQRPDSVIAPKAP